MTKQNELSASKSIVVCAIVLGCFAVLWPKIFHPMFFGSQNNPINDDAYRPERGPGYGHPGLRDTEGQPRRTIEKEIRPGPVPGMRPTMGGPGIQPQKQPQQGTMGILMPLYTIGIVIFFVYTVMRLIFKKDEVDEEKEESSSFREYLKDSKVLQEAETRYQRQKIIAAQAEAREAAEMAARAAEAAKIMEKEKEENRKKEKEPEKPRKEVVVEEDSDDESSEEETEEEEEGECQDPKEEDQEEEVVEETTGVNDKEQTKGKTKKEEGNDDPRDAEIKELKIRLQETETAMKMIMAQMGNLQNLKMGQNDEIPTSG